jgi:indolepyruvate ferredoxin oxidoreductase alpha subunit
MSRHIVLGDEALALGAVHAGMTAAYGYPGTPSTEIIEYLLPRAAQGGFIAQWCANEKTAYEEALGTSFAGCRALVTMKHVGLNVAADPFMNSALLNIKGGLVVVVADDPSMHSSQNEQDSRCFADFAKVVCLEPVSQQDCYDLARRAFELSEELHQPVLIRLVTRLSHSRAAIEDAPARPRNPAAKALDKQNWMLIPALARKRWDHVLALQAKVDRLSEDSPLNILQLPASGPGSGVAGSTKAKVGYLCTGLGFNYFRENLAELPDGGASLPWLQVAQYPVPAGKIRRLAAAVETIVVLEEGYPFVERQVKGLLPGAVTVRGKLDGLVPASGELTPENIRPAMGLPVLECRSLGLAEAEGCADIALPGRPPQLCKGCPHGDSYLAVKDALAGWDDSVVTADIGCYALGVLPPYAVPETIICMGASIGVAKGAWEAGYKHAVAVIGDSTFFHSGITPLIDCISAKAGITLLILDNSTVGMTGGQETILSGGRLPAVVEALGVEKAHIRVIEPLPKNREENTRIIREETDYAGVSVIIAVRECLETLRKHKPAKGAAE